jgi:hypothetical protein
MWPTTAMTSQTVVASSTLALLQPEMLDRRSSDALYVE